MLRCWEFDKINNKICIRYHLVDLQKRSNKKCIWWCEFCGQKPKLDGNWGGMQTHTRRPRWSYEGEMKNAGIEKKETCNKLLWWEKKTRMALKYATEDCAAPLNVSSKYASKTTNLLACGTYPVSHQHAAVIRWSREPSDCAECRLQHRKPKKKGEIIFSTKFSFSTFVNSSEWVRDLEEICNQCEFSKNEAFDQRGCTKW